MSQFNSQHNARVILQLRLSRHWVAQYGALANQMVTNPCGSADDCNATLDSRRDNHRIWIPG